jgi:hypothetical protein
MRDCAGGLPTGPGVRQARTMRNGSIRDRSGVVTGSVGGAAGGILGPPHRRGERTTAMADESPLTSPVPARPEPMPNTPPPPHHCISDGSPFESDAERVRLGRGLRRRPWQRVARWVRGQIQPYDVVAARLRRLEEVLEVLAAARSLIEHGWVQDAFFAVRPRSQPSAAPAAVRVSSSVSYLDRDDLVGTCLVGAVVYAVRQRHPGDARAEIDGVGPVVDVLWDGLQESRGLGGPGVACRVAAPAVHAARVRDLTRWNDQRDRRRSDVLGLLDLAASRTIMTAVTTPEQAGPLR